MIRIKKTSTLAISIGIFSVLVLNCVDANVLRETGEGDGKLEYVKEIIEEGHPTYYQFKASDPDKLRKIRSLKKNATTKKWEVASIMRRVENGKRHGGVTHEIKRKYDSDGDIVFQVEEEVLKKDNYVIQIFDCSKDKTNGTHDSNWNLGKDNTKTLTKRLTLVLPIGYDPPIYKNIVVFPTSEQSLGSDLNCDSDTRDTILRYQNLETGEVANTGLIASGAHHSMDIYENIVAFVGEDSHICCYDINTGTVRRIGATGSHLSIYGNIIAFSSKGTVHYSDLCTQTLVNTGTTGYSPVIYQNTIVFHAPTPKHTIWVYNLRTGESVNTGAIGKNPTIYENIIAFETLEFSITGDLNGDGDAHDMVIRFCDLETQTITSTGAVGFYPAIYGSRIVFATRECDICQDLNGDDEIFGEIIRYYDLKTDHLINTGELGTQPGIYGNMITFYLWETWVGQDLNGDGYQSGTFVETYQIAVAKMALAGPETMLFLAFLVAGSVIAYFKRNGQHHHT